MNKYKPDFNTCAGPSMYPTIKTGDAFKLDKKITYSDYRIGDIIVYPHPKKPIDVVHRIIKVKADGVITRGDNNNLIDPYTIKFGDIKGRVAYIKRGSREIKVSNGIRGFIWHKIMLFRKISRIYIAFPVKMFNAVIIKSRIFFFIQPLLKLSIIIVKREEKNEENLVFKKKVIGKKFDDEPWKIRFPYKLFIDPGKLK